MSALTAIVMAVGLMPLPAFAETAGGQLVPDAGRGLTVSGPEGMTAQAGGDHNQIPYIDAEGNPQFLTAYADWTLVQSDTYAFQEAKPSYAGYYDWYFVSSNVSIDKRVTVSGNVNMILFDGCTLTCKKGMALADGAKLTIWQQSGRTGKIVAKSNNDHKAAITVNAGSKLTINGGTIQAETYTDDAAGIGGDKGKSAGTIEINAGTVTARSDMNAAGIGGGKGGTGGTITINGGTVIATANDEDGAGIGGGEHGFGGTITINGGTVTATGAGEAAGIGGGYAESSGTVKIAGGTVTATGASHGAGIGGGNKGDGDTITISGGTVTARGGAYAAGIGAGGDSGADEIHISGADTVVKAWGGTESAGIGSANKGHVKTIEITGGKVYAFGASKAAGIGGGDGNEQNGTYGTITISGASTQVRAIGGKEAAGIGTGNDAGGGAKANSGTINITGGAYVEAIGGASGDNFVIRDDGNIYREYYNEYTSNHWSYYRAYCEQDKGDSGAGIGGGDTTPSGTINISGAGTKAEAYGSLYAAGVGSGDSAGSTGNITITDGATVNARGGGMDFSVNSWKPNSGNGGAGVGGGRQCGSDASGKIVIRGATVNAFGGAYAAGIGGGDEGGVKEISISDGADVSSRGGLHGAGIGTGDVSSNGNKDAWKTGSINISGADTKVYAVGSLGDVGYGDAGNGAAGIGGGDDGYGCTVKIENVGMTDGAIGYVRATGPQRAAGIGGGPGKAFKSITIENAKVTANGGYGAGIGGGGGALQKSNPSHVNGGTISIKNSNVVAASSLGGAGIGGGIFGRADSISISGGVTVANGGQTVGIGHIPVMASLMLDVSNGYNDMVDLIAVSGMGSLVADNLAEFGKAWGAVIAQIGQKAAGGVSVDLIYYTGAGIGGGYHEKGGTITIGGDARVQSACGLLPEGLDPVPCESVAIGAGKNHGDEGTTRVSIAYDSLATTCDITLKPTYYDWNPKLDPPYNQTWHYEPVMEGVQVYTYAANAPSLSNRVQSCDFANIVPAPQPATVTFEKNAEDATGAMDAQTFQPNTSAQLKANSFTRAGYVFAGWNTVPNPTAENPGTAFADKQEIAPTGNLTLYAQWEHGPVTITYMVHQGQVPMHTQVVEYGGKATLLNPTQVEGNKFDHWGTSEGGGGTHYSGGATLSDVTHDLILWAGVTETAADQLSFGIVTYKPNGGTGDEQADYVTATSASDQKNATYEARPDTTFTKTGYHMWAWRIEGTDGDYVSCGSKPFSWQSVRSMTLLADWTPNTYAVTFDKNAGDALGTMRNQEFTYDSEQSLSANAFTREGYDFAGWNTVAAPSEDNPGIAYSDGQSLMNLATGAEGDKTATLYAQWAKKPQADADKYYTVTFVDNAPKVAPSGQDAPEAKTCLQLFKLGADEQAAAKPLMALADIARISEGGFAFEHYTFAGWNTRADGTGVAYADQAEFQPEEDTTLYAQWQKARATVNFDVDGGTLGGTYGGEYAWDATIALPTPAREGYAFKHWEELDADGAWTGSNFKAGESYAIDADGMTLRAVWELQQTVYYVKQAADGSWPEDAAGAASEKRAGYSATYVVTDEVAAKYADGHYALKGYTTTYADDGACEGVQAGQTISLGGKASALYLYYELAPFDLTFYGDTEGTVVWKTESVPYGTWLAGFATETPPAREGYTFAGWATEPNIRVNSLLEKDGTTLKPKLQGKMMDWNNTTATADMAVYPIWIRDRLKVVLDADGGVLDAAQATTFWVDIDEKVVMRYLKAATREGYTLAGWYTSGGVLWNGSNWNTLGYVADGWTETEGWGVTPEYCDKAGGEPVYLTDSARKFNYYTVTLTARWSPGPDAPEPPAGAAGEYTITFDSLGGSPVASIKQQSGTAVALPADPVKSGYAFGGWYPALPAEMPTSDLTVLATWVPQNYTITFDCDGGSAIEPITDMVGARIAAPANPTKPGFTFMGWMKNGGTDIVALPSYMPDDNPTYKAKWKGNQAAPMVAAAALDAHTVQVPEPSNGAEYVIVRADQVPAEADWAQSKKAGDGTVEWDGLSPLTAYDVCARMAETEELAASDIATAQVTTPKFTPEAPAAPSVWSAGPTTVVVDPVSEGQEYAIVVASAVAPADDGAWVSPDANGQVKWGGLDEDGEYAVYGRIKGNDVQNPSPASKPTEVVPGKAPAKAYTVRWVDDDGTLLEEDASVLGGSTPSYDGVEPSKAPTAQHTYAFAGWTPEVVPVTGDVTYTAAYTSAVNEYTVRFVNEDGTVLQSGKVAYGATPSYKGDVPKKVSDGKSTYAFAGWKPEVVPVTGDAAYTATYEATPVDSPAKKASLTFDYAGGTLDGKASLVIVAGVGDTVTMPAAPTRDGYAFKCWKDPELSPGDRYKVEGDHAFTAVWEQEPAPGADLAAYEGAAAKAGFTDLADGAWYMSEGLGDGHGGVACTYLDYVVGRGLMSGYSGTTLFGPDDTLSRGMAATIIYRMATGETARTTDNNVGTKFSDVPAGRWYSAAVAWCAEEGVVTGYAGSALFGPDDDVTREQLATMICRYCVKAGGQAPGGADLSRFSDERRIAGWAREGVAHCVANGIVSGYSDGSGRFGPQDTATRCQMAKIIAVTACLIV